MGTEELKNMMIEIKSKVEANPKMDVNDVVALVEEYYTENNKKKT